jgi:putative ABC transport system permease protein
MGLPYQHGQHICCAYTNESEQVASAARFLAEGLFIGVMGGLAGALLGYLLAEGISSIGIPMPPPPGMARGYIGRILVTPGLVADGLLLAAATALVASMYPAWKASRMVIAEALRHGR